MFFVLLLLFTAVPIVEIALLVKLGSALGFWPAMALVLGTGVVGAALARWQGFRTLARIRQQLEQGVLPAREMTDGAMILAAGLLLITPGALTDVLGLALLIPPVRSLLRLAVLKRFQASFEVERFEFRSPPGNDPNVVDAHGVHEPRYQGDERLPR